jgi:predicted NUDIX family NTP pyrophosphohydrolase
MTRSKKQSAGLVLYRVRGGTTEVLLGHPGGPFWANKDDAAWSIPKGEVEAEEDLLAAARRETLEETGLAPGGPFTSLGKITQKSGKVVHAWAAAHDVDPTAHASNLVEVEWPPRSGKTVRFPEVDRVAYFTLEAARVKVNPAQTEFLDRLALLLAGRGRG